MAPITAPAIWPPERWPDEDPAVGLDVEVKIGGIVVDVGMVTSLHRVAAFEFMQQESVELGELAPQNPHNPTRFDPYPHSSDSLSAPEMQVTVNESAGRAHTVKSERTWLI